MRIGLGLTLAVLAAGAPAWHAGASAAVPPPLRVCADPDNLPFTNDRGEGFENHLAELLARDLGTRVEYTWWAQRRGFLRNTLNAGRCDVVLGLPTGVEQARTTRPYYRSTYVFVDRRDRHRTIRSFDDARLRGLRIGVPLVSDDGANAPPSHALTRRGLGPNLVRVSVYGDGGTSPGARLVGAVATGDVDVAVAWGPVAGYFGARQPVPMRVTPVSPQIDPPALPLVFDMSMATRRDDPVRLAALDGFLRRRRTAIDRVLAEFHVPRVDVPAAAGGR
jgi:mxaJ protein